MTTDVETAAQILGIGRSLAYDLVRADEFPVRLIRLRRRVLLAFQVSASRWGFPVSMSPRELPQPPSSTARVARAAFARPALAMRVRDELRELFADEQFAKAFATRARPGLSPGQLALVTVLQFASNLTDRQAAEAVRAPGGCAAGAAAGANELGG
jgi:hypothetical protein